MSTEEAVNRLAMVDVLDDVELAGDEVVISCCRWAGLLLWKTVMTYTRKF